MSSDPIEVLRELAASWHRAALNCHECGKPSQARVFRECAAQVTSALASLSAPKPPPMNDNAVAVNESAPVNDKPESAEAVPAGYVQIAKPALREMLGDERMAQLEAMCVYPTAPPRPEMWDVRDGQGDLYARQPLEKAASIVMQHPDQDLRLSPAPRPEASAPVGVEGLVKAMRTLAGVGIPVKPECVGRWADQLRALAQQPAADFDAWQKNPYTKVLMTSISEDYVPKHGQQPAAVDEADKEGQA